MVSLFAHILFVVVLGATLVSTPPKGTLQLKLFDNECKVFDELNVEQYFIGETQLTFQTIDRGWIKYPKNNIKEIHGSVVGKNETYLARHPIYGIENITNSQCKYNLAKLGTKSIQ